MSIYFVFTLNGLNGISVQAARVVLTLYALALGAQPFTVGILAGTFSVLPMLLALTTGRLADRFGSRWLLTLGGLAGGLGMLTSYLVSAVPALFAAAALIGLTTAIYNVSLQNLVGVLSDPPVRARNFSNSSLIGSTTSFVGPLIAGFSIEHSGHAYACLYLAVLTLVPVAMLVIWGAMLPKGAREVAHARGGVRTMLSEPGVRRVLATGSIQNTGDSLYGFYMPIYTHALGLSAFTIGIVLAMYAAAAFVVRLALPRLIARFREEKVLAYGFYIGAVSLVMAPLFKNAPMLALVSFVFGLGMGCCGPIVTMLMFGNAPPGRSGEALGLKITINHLTKVVTPVVFGSIASAFGLAPVFWISGAMLGAGGRLSHPKKKG